MIREWVRVYTIDKILGFLLIHHFTRIMLCLLVCEMCGLNPHSFIRRVEYNNVMYIPAFTILHAGTLRSLRPLKPNPRPAYKVRSPHRARR
jgi:hypothetical protein